MDKFEMVMFWPNFMDHPVGEKSGTPRSSLLANAAWIERAFDVNDQPEMAMNQNPGTLFWYPKIAG